MEKRIGLVFPGYGEQYIGMGKDLYDEVRIVQDFFEQAAGATDKNFVKLMFASSDKDISAVENAYLAIYLFESALFEMLWQQGLRPDFVAGYGIGEYAACFASRSLSFIDGLYFLNKYSQFYKRFLEDKELSVLRVTRDFTVDSLQDVLDEMSTDQLKAYISAQNTEHAFYVSGDKPIIEKLQQYCVDHTIRKVREVGSGYGLHSERMNEVAEQLKLYYHKIQFKDLKVPVITNADGVYVTSAHALQSATVRRINNRVQWHEVMKGFVGCDVIISVGPGEQLIEWFKEVYPDKEYHVVSSLKDIEAIEYLFEKQSEQLEAEDNSTKGEKNLSEADKINDRPSDYDIDNDK